MANKSIEEKLTEGRQYRATMEVRALPEELSDSKIVEGYATVFDEPYEMGRDGNYLFLEQVDTGAFEDTDMSDVIMQYDHVGRVFARTGNGTLRLEVDERGLKITADLGGTEIGRQLYDEIRGRYTTKMSFGFSVDKSERLIEEDSITGFVKVLRKIKRIGKLYDVSAVSLPANNATEIVSARSWYDGVIEQLTEECRKAEARERQRQRIRIMLEI